MFNEKYRFFLEIAKYGSITKAAEHMLISQSALSKYLHRLEEELHTKLFDRTSLPMKLTRSGELFMRYVVQGSQLENQMMRQIDELQGNIVETLRIGVGTWRGSCSLPKILPVFQEQYPFIRIELIEGVSDVLADAIAKDNVDVCIMGAVRRYPGFEQIPLHDERILLIGNNSNLMVNQLHVANTNYFDFVHVDIHDFQQERFILTTEHQQFARVIEDYFQQVHFRPIDTMRVQNLQTSMYMVSNGNYFAFLPEIALHSLFIPENITFFTVGDPVLTYPISVVFSKQENLSNAAKLFVESVLMYYRKTFPGSVKTWNGNLASAVRVQ